MANQKVIFELTAKSVDEIADEISKSQSGWAKLSLIEHRISRKKL
jgi:hypothetical protein